MFNVDERIGYNRSLKAYNSNPENEEVSFNECHKAMELNMNLLKFEDSTGNAIGQVNWFGVHGRETYACSRAGWSRMTTCSCRPPAQAATQLRQRLGSACSYKHRLAADARSIATWPAPAQLLTHVHRLPECTELCRLGTPSVAANALAERVSTKGQPAAPPPQKEL